jgi:hypothetical protein
LLPADDTPELATVGGDGQHLRSSRDRAPLTETVVEYDVGVAGLTSTVTSMSWPPMVGAPLPRAEMAWYERIKLDGWILAERGHGLEWNRVFQVGIEDSGRVWEAIATAVLEAPVGTVRDRGTEGVVCGVQVELTIGERTAPVMLSWHYADPSAAPRLVTAYINL